MKKQFIFCIGLLLVTSAINGMQTTSALSLNTDTEKRFRTLLLQQGVYQANPAMRTRLCSGESVNQLRKATQEIQTTMRAIDADIQKQLPAHAVLTKSQLVTALHSAFARIDHALAQALGEIAPGKTITNLAPFFEHIISAHTLKRKLFTALAHINPTHTSLLAQTMESALHSTPDLMPREDRFGLKGLLSAALQTVTAVKKDRETLALASQSDDELLAHIAPVAPPSSSASASSSTSADRPTHASFFTASGIADSLKKLSNAVITHWPTAKDAAAHLQGTDFRKYESYLCSPINARVSTGLASIVASASDNSLGRWIIGAATHRHPALPALGNAYINGVSATRTIATTPISLSAGEEEEACTLMSEETFDRAFTSGVRTITTKATELLNPDSVAALTEDVDAAMLHAPAISRTIDTLATHTHDAQTEIEAFLTFLKELGEHDAH